MKTKCIIALMFVVSSLACPAKDKLVEKSGKTPDWLMSAGNDSFSVFAESDDLDAARDRCLADIRQYIAGSIAANIVSVEKSNVESINDNGSESIYSSYSLELKSAAAKLPFITGISLSDAIATYWEKYRRGSDKSCYYRFHVLYPFTKATRDMLVKEFLDYDNGMYEKYLSIKRAYKEMADVSEINSAIMELEPLAVYFFDDVRRKEVESLLKTYRTAYSRISIVPMNHELGKFTYSLYLDGMKVTCSRMPALVSDTATGMVVKPEGRDYVLYYDYDLCYPGDDNFIQINYSFPGALVRYRYQFDVKEKETAAVPVGIIEIVASRKDGSWTADVSLMIRSRTGEPVEIRNLEFRLSSSVGVNSREMFAFEGEGTYPVHFMDEPSRIDGIDAGRGMATGTMEVVSGGNRETVAFTLPYNFEIH